MALATLLLVAGCLTPGGADDSRNDKPTREQQYAQLRERPNIDEAQQQWERLLEEARDLLRKEYDTLDIYWAADKGVRIMMPDRLDAEVRRDMTVYSPGQSWGIEHFRFADGTSLSLQRMIDRMPAFVLDGSSADDVLTGSAGNNEFHAAGGLDDARDRRLRDGLQLPLQEHSAILLDRL